jgi:carbonic anhydrase
MAAALNQKVDALVKASPESAKKLEEAIAALEKTYLNSGAASGPEDPIARLGRGFQTFKTNHYNKDTALFDKLKTGQWPKYMVIACSDSRVDPATILGFQPGEAFMVRNVANMVPAWEPKGGYPSVSSALEYAVKHLKVEHIIVIGHRLCGGIKALVTTEEGQGSHDFIESWLEIGKPARAVTKAVAGSDHIDEQCKFCEKESVNVSLTNLLSYPWVKEKVIAKNVSLHGGFYDFVEGSFQVWDFEVNVSHSKKF